MTPNPAVFVPVLVASIIIFAWNCHRRLGLIALGRSEERPLDVIAGVRELFRYAFAKKRVVNGPSGFNHLVFFWSFIILLAANAEFMVGGVFPAASLSRLPLAVYRPIMLLFDLASLATLTAVVIALVRRTLAPPYREGRTPEAYLILALIGVHMLGFFGVKAAEIALGTETAAPLMPVSSFIAEVFFTPHSSLLAPLASFFWWVHASALLVFIAVLIPCSKHLHIFTAIANCLLRRPGRPNTQTREQFEEEGIFGAGRVDRFTRKDLFDTFACTKCGRCQNVCPAFATGKALNPRQVIEDIRLNLVANGYLLKQRGTPDIPLIGGEGEGSIPEDAIWACTSCGACMEACPAFIEHLPKLVEMRRHLVEMESNFPEELLNLFENMEGRSNPWGIAPSERAKWSSQLEAKPFEAGKTEYLFYVGCAGAFDSRSKQVTVALATILDAAGVSWGILGRDEKCCGDSLRRLGNEFAFDKMARENVRIFQERGVTKVITHCPHCFSTLKNDYRQYGLELEVIHHSELINRLMNEGKLKLNSQVTGLGSILFHDSCYLGRHNDVYQAPRELITKATGQEPEEFGRNLDNSFCCGAGGGRMWLEEHTGTRINRERVQEALRAKPDTVCVSCPYCMTMFGDGLKDEGAHQVQVKDIAEVVAEGLKV